MALSERNEWPWNSSDLLVVPFIFVPRGQPDPDEWLAAHPGAIRIPAVLVPRPGAAPSIEWDADRALATWLTSSAALGQPYGNDFGANIRPASWSPESPHAAPATPHPATMPPLPPDPDEKLKAARMRAFLRLIRWEENGPVSDDQAYHARFGGHDPMTDEDMLNYKPKAETLRVGRGRPLPFTAAGAYQITKQTWESVSRHLNVKNFTRQNQDSAAEFIIDSQHARDAISIGDLHTAYTRLNRQWVSLPGGSQSKTSLSQADSKFKEFLDAEMQHHAP